MNKLNDLALITQVLVLHDNRGFDALVRKYQQSVRRFFLNQTNGDQLLSDDLAQETFVKAFESLSSFKMLSSFHTWLYRIAYNVFYNYVRSSRQTVDLDSPEVDTSYSVGPNDLTVSGDVYKALQTLKEEERTCVTLQLIEDLPIEKIVEITGMKEGTVKSHLSRGKEKLTTFLKNNGYGR